MAKRKAQQIIQEDAERQARVILAKSKEAAAVAAADEARQERIKAEKAIQARKGDAIRTLLGSPINPLSHHPSPLNTRHRYQKKKNKKPV